MRRNLTGRSGRAFGLAVAAVAGAAVALQYGVVLSGAGISIPGTGPDPLERSVNFFSYLTILSNPLIVLATIATGLSPNSALGRFPRMPPAATSAIGECFSMRSAWRSPSPPSARGWFRSTD